MFVESCFWSLSIDLSHWSICNTIVRFQSTKIEKNSKMMRIFSPKFVSHWFQRREIFGENDHIIFNWSSRSKSIDRDIRSFHNESERVKVILQTSMSNLILSSIRFFFLIEIFLRATRKIPSKLAFLALHQSIEDELSVHWSKTPKKIWRSGRVSSRKIRWIQLTKWMKFSFL